MPLLLVTSLNTHWTCPYTCIVLQWICGLCGIIDWLLYPVLTGWNVVQILGLVHLVMTINMFIIPLSRPHSAYLHWQASIQFLVQRYVWCIGSNNLTSAHGGHLLAKSQIYWRITIHSGQFDGNSLALRKSRIKCQKAFQDIIIIIWIGIKNQDLSKRVKNE
jgi:hypothetical protein